MSQYFLLVVALVLSSRPAAGDCDGTCPHARPNPVADIMLGAVVQDHRVILREGGSPKLECEMSLLTEPHSFNVKVSWTDVHFSKATDWIGMWPADADLRLFTPPIKFQFTVPGGAQQCNYYRTEAACSADPVCHWVRLTSSTFCGSAYPPGNGSVTFQVLNMRTDVVFYYISGNAQFPELITSSKPVAILNQAAPAGAHLAFGPSPTSMRVYWQAGEASGAAGVRFGSSSGIYDRFASGQARPGRQFSKQDLCDTDVQPAGRQGYFKPPVLLEASLEGLVPGNTYWYVYGDNATGWSGERSFTAAPAPDPVRPTIIAAFGDLGQTEADDSFHHSFDFANRGEIPSLNTTRQLAADSKAEMILHIGDISYAVGYLCQWDTFFHQIERISSRKAWMTSIGNHEQGFSGSYLPGTDSGGECGVPYNAHFPFASQEPLSDRPFSQRRPWYSFTYGSVAFIQMSTEHDFTQGSEQNAWIEQALKNVDRSVTPWVVFSGHRPMYSADSYAEDIDMAKRLQEHVEPLLLQYSVDVALWAHYHAYVRFCRVSKGACVQDDASQGGIQHYIIGMAGYHHSSCPRGSSDIINKCDDTKYGYIRMNFQNTTALVVEYVDNEDGSIIESSVVQRVAQPNLAAVLV